MLQEILERILLKYFGSYLQDFDQNKISLAIWNGKLKIEGLRLKPSIFSQLNLPLELRYSFIGNLEIVVPWTKLSILPVELNILNIFVIIGPLNQKYWSSRFDSLDNKLQLIEEIIRGLLSKQKKTEGLLQKKPGYFDLFVTKIIDNVQINIENIHILFENDLGNCPFSLGITLKQLTLETKDESWSQKIFYDRTNPKNKNKIVNKHLILRHLGVYLNSKNKKFLSKSNNFENINEEMKAFAMNFESDRSIKKLKTQRINHYLLDISFDFKLTINFDNNYYTIPEKKGEMTVDNININLKNTQIQNFIRLLEFFNEFEFFMDSFKREIHYFKAEKPISFNFKSLIKKNKRKIVQNLWAYCVEAVIFDMRKTNYIHYLNQYFSLQRGSSVKFKDIKDPHFSPLKKICQNTSMEYLKIWSVLFIFKYFLKFKKN